MDLSVSVWRENGETIVSVAGELDLYAAPIVRAALVEVVMDGSRQVTLNLRDLEFIDAAGVGVLLGALRRLHHEDGELVLRAVQPLVRRVLELTHVIDDFTIVD